MPLMTRLARRGLKLHIQINHFPGRNTESPSESRINQSCKTPMENMFQNLCSPNHSECAYIQSYLKQNNLIQSDLKQTKPNQSDDKENDLRNSLLIQNDLPNNDMLQLTFKDCFTNLSPCFNIKSKDVWQEKARLEKEIYRNKIERYRGKDNI